MSKVIKKIGKILLHSVTGVVLVAILLILALALALSLPRVQSYTASKVVGYITENTEAKISIDAISIEQLSKLCVKGLYVEDLKGDTLIYFSKLTGTINRSELLRKGRLVPSNIKAEDGLFALTNHIDEEDSNLNQVLDQIMGLFPANEKEDRDGFSIEHIEVENSIFRKCVKARVKEDQKGVINYSDMDLAIRSLRLGELVIKDGVVGLYEAEDMNVTDKSGASLQNSSFGQLEISTGTLDFREVDFEADGSHLSLPRLIIKGSTWESYSDFCDLVTISLETTGSTIEPLSAGRFVEALGTLELKGEEITGHFVGTVNDFNANISGRVYDSEVMVNGDVRSVTRFRNLEADAEIDLKTTSEKVKMIYGNIVGSQLPAAAKEWIERFDTLALAGIASVSPNRVVADAELTTNLGSASVDGTITYCPSEITFDGTLSGDDLKAGKIFKVEQLGTADISLEGAVAIADGDYGGNLRVNIDKVGWANYDYNNIEIRATMANKAFSATATATDPNLIFTLEGDGSLSQTNPEYNMILALERADFGALGIAKQDSSAWLAADVEATLTGRSLDDMVGRAMINNLIYATATDTLSTELVNIALRGGEHDKSFSLRSNVADVEYRSTAPYAEVLTYLTQTFPTQLPWVKSSDNENHDVPEGQKAPYGDRIYMADDYTSVNLKIFDGENLASSLIPESNISAGSSLTLEFSPKAQEFALNLESDLLQVRNILISGINIDAKGNGPDLELLAESSSLKANELTIPDITIKASADADHKVETNIYFSSTDAALSGQLNAQAQLGHDASGALTATAKLLNSYLISPEQRWQIAANNIEYSQSGVTIDNFLADTGASSIVINGAIAKSDKQPIEVVLENVTLDEWMSLLASMDDVDGNLSGHLELYSALNQPYGKGELSLSAITMGEIDIDPLVFNVDIPKRSTTASASLKNTITRNTLAQGSYNYSTGAYRAKIAMKEFHFSILEPLLNGALHDLDGMGNIDVQLSGGDTQGININGTVTASDLATTIDYTGAHYTIPALKLSFNDNKCHLSPIRIEDSEGGWASAEADVSLSNLGAITFDASLEPHNLIAIDLDSDSNGPFYGKVYVANGGVKLSSNGQNGIVVSGGVNTGANSVFSLPLKGNNDFAGADFVTFVDKSEQNEEDDKNSQRRGKKGTGGSSLAVDMMLGVDTNTLLRLIIDPETDNVIEARGNASLGITYDARKSDFAIRGDYQLTEGVYNFNFQNIITKNFNINPGSYLRWNGSPLDANIDVAATYKLKTSLAPLLGTESTASRASTPVECIVKLTGSLAKVDVSFDINVPTANTEYQTILSSYFSSQEMMATQFVYLLALGNFYSDSSTGPTTTAGVAGTAIGLDFLASQVSRLVSNDIFKINLKYKAIDDTSSSYSVDFQTEIIDDRLTLELEANVDTGDYYETIGDNNQISAGGSITYRLDPTGSIYLKGFSRTIDRFDENQGLQENGVGIYFQRSFNHFNELFNKKRGTTNRENEKNGNFAPEATPQAEVIDGEEEVVEDKDVVEGEKDETAQDKEETTSEEATEAKDVDKH